ncbi:MULTISPECIES: acyltransferase [Clostridium]|uniref:acyltransferase n=1 Tax=Clostridium TaxID=1485 RepID=UPI00082401BC|nr:MULTISPECIES: hypothetical protein [Clostridium]PJI08950.1 galactoside O-acetyltransferase [Clostridium sp. CT7]
MDLYKIFSLLLGMPKTLYINFKYFKIKDAIKLPIIVSHKTYLKNVKGSIKINSKIKPFMVKIGFGDVAIFDRHKSRTIFSNTGNIIFNGTAYIGHGSKLSVAGCLILGDNFCISAQTSIICNKKVSFGDNCLLSWENLIMDTDFHKIKNCKNDIINNDKNIEISNNVWIGCRCTVLKGTFINENTVVAANSCIANKFHSKNVIIGSNPAKIIKENITWEI